MVSSAYTCALILLAGFASCTHHRYGTLNWRCRDVNNPREIEFTFYTAVRRSWQQTAENRGFTNSNPSVDYWTEDQDRDAENQICRTTTNCWRNLFGNAEFFFEYDFDGGNQFRRNCNNNNCAPSAFTWHYRGSTPSSEAATEDRVYEDGVRINAGRQNWLQFERVHFHTYPEITTYRAGSSPDARQTTGVRNTESGERMTITALVNINNIVDNGIKQNPHCSSFAIFPWPYRSGQQIQSQITLRNLCLSPFDPNLSFRFSTFQESGLNVNGNIFDQRGLVVPQLTQTGVMTWAPDRDGLYAMSFIVEDSWGNSNTLDIFFDVNEQGNTPYFVEVRDTIGGPPPVSTIDIFDPPPREVFIGQSISFGIWAYAPAGFMTAITFSFAQTRSASIAHTCNGMTQFCELQFSFTPELGQPNLNLCAIAISTVGSYVGAPSDPTPEVTFCVPIIVQERDFIFVTGIVRDFRVDDQMDTGIPTNQAALTDPNFLEGQLDDNLRPVFDVNAPSGSVSQAQFGTWFNDVPAVNTRLTTTIVLGLISGDAGEPGSVYEGVFQPFFPINAAGFDTGLDPNTTTNSFFTYDIITQFVYRPGTSVQFSSSDYLWVFIDGRLVLADTTIEEMPSTTTLNLGSLTWINPPPGAASNNVDLVEDIAYTMSLFFVHRSSAWEPQISWQFPGGSICDAVSGSNETFSFPPGGFTGALGSSLFDTQNGQGMTAVLPNGDLRIASADPSFELSSSAVWYAVNGVPERLTVRDGFSTSFTVTIGSLGDSRGTRVPGFALVIQSNSGSARGGAAAGLGYEGILNAAAIEFDALQDPQKGDPTFSHAGFHISLQDGIVLADEATDRFTDDPSESIGLTHGQSYNITISYFPGAGFGDTRARGSILGFVNSRSPQLQVSVEAEEFDIFTDGAFVGLTAATTTTDGVDITISDWSFTVVNPSPALTSIIFAPLTTPAGIISDATTIQARDVCGRNIITGGSADSITATLVGEDDETMVPIQIIDLNNGQYILAFTPTIAQRYTLRVLFDGLPIDTIDAGNTRMIQVVAGAVDRDESMLFASENPVIAGSVNQAIFQLRDSFGNVVDRNLLDGAVADVSVTITPDLTSQSPPGSVSSIFSIATNNYTTTWTTTRAAQYTLRVFYKGIDIGGSPQLVDVIAGNATLENSALDLTAPPQFSLVSEATGSFRIILSDRFGNIITRDPAPFAVVYERSGPLNEPGCTLCGVEDTSSLCAFVGDRYTCSYTLFVAGSHSIRPLLTQSGTTVGPIPDSNFTVTVAVGVEARNSIPVDNPPVTTVVGSPRAILIQARDRFNATRTVANELGQFSAEFDPPLPTPAVGPLLQPGGQYSFEYTVTNTTLFGEIMVTIRLEFTMSSELIFNGIFTELWVADVASSLVVPDVLMGLVGVNNSFSIAALDVFGNLCDRDFTNLIQVRLQLPNSGVNTPILIYQPPNDYTVIWTTTLSGLHTLQFFVNDVLLTASTRMVMVAPGQATTGFVNTNDEGWSVGTIQFNTTSFRVLATDEFGNLIGSADPGDLPFSLNVTAATGCSMPTQQLAPSSMIDGVYTFTYNVSCPENTFYMLEVFFNESQSIDSTTLRVIEANALNGESVVLGLPGVFEGLVSDATNQFFILALDADENNRTNIEENSNFVFAIQAINLPFFDGEFIPVLPTAVPVNGSAIVPVSNLVFQYAGTYNLRIFDGLELAQSLTLGGYDITVVAGPAARFLINSNDFASLVLRNANVITGISAVAGTPTDVQIRLNDRYGQPVNSSDLDVSATITYENGTQATIPAEYLGDDSGSNNLWNLLFPDSFLSVAGRHSFSVFVNTTLIGQTSYQFTILPGEVDPSRSVVSISGAAAEAPVAAGTATSVRVTLADRFGNPTSVGMLGDYELTTSNNLGALDEQFNFVANGTVVSSSVTVSASIAALPSDCLVANTVQSCFEVSVVIERVGVVVASVSRQGQLFPSTANFTVANSPMISSSLTQIFQLPSTSNAGSSINFTVATFDIFGNPFIFTQETDLVSFLVLVTVPPPTQGTITLANEQGLMYVGGGVWSVVLVGCDSTPPACLSTCRTCLAGQYFIAARFRGTDILAGSTSFSNPSFQVLSLGPSRSQLEFIYTPDILAATVGQTAVDITGIALRTFDIYFNRVAGPDEFPATIDVEFYAGVPPSCADMDDPEVNRVLDLTASVTFHTNGVYNVTYSANGVIGDFILAVFVNGELVCDTFTQVRILPGDFSPESTQVTSFTNIPASGSGTMELTFFDSFGNAVPPNSGTEIVVTGLGDFTLSSPDATFELAMGNHTATVLGTAPLVLQITYATTSAGRFPFDVFVSGTRVSNFLSGAGSSEPVIVVSFGPVAAFRVVSIPPARELGFGVAILQATDMFGNDVLDSNFSATLAFEREDGVPYSVTSIPLNVTDGLSFHRFQFFLAGRFRPVVTIVSSTGDVVVNQAPVQGFTLPVQPSVCSAESASTPYRCDNGTCVSSYANCAEATGFCPQGQVRCASDGSCQSNNFQCPCPAGYERCATGACEVVGTCLGPSVCPSGYVQCDFPQVCRASPEECPSPTVCPPNTFACSDGFSCASSPERCITYRRGDQCPPGLGRCGDGSCALSLESCPTAVTCPEADQVLCAGGGGLCVGDNFQCLEQYECDEITLDNPVRCQDGSCRSDDDDCPSTRVCPPTFILCEGGSCAADLASCPIRNNPDIGQISPADAVFLPPNFAPCPAGSTPCPDNSCASNIALCPSKPSCPPSSPVRCPDDSCVAVASLCNDPSVCEAGETQCIDGTCTTTATACPNTATCTGDFPVLCPDGSCGAQAADCAPTERCQENEFRCSRGFCRPSRSLCPSYPTCPDSHPVKCGDGACRAAPDQCVDPSALLCDEGEVKCPTGECALSLDFCATPITCPEGFVRCFDGTCRATCPDLGGSDPSPCAQDSVQCPQAGIGFTCRSNLRDCPSDIVCPDGWVRCVDKQCAPNIGDCPVPPEVFTSVNQVACPDGSFEAQITACGAAVTCGGFFTCWDSTCRVDPRDCPDFLRCEAATPFLCPDASCRSRPWQCRATRSCPLSTPVRCPVSSQDCQTSAEECISPFDLDESIIFEDDGNNNINDDDSDAEEIAVCAPGFERCRGGFCARRAECMEFECTPELPAVCSQGTCASSMDECPLLNGCLFIRPFKCSSGECVATAADCPTNGPTCEAGFLGSANQQGTGATDITVRRACADGSCLATLSSMGGVVDYSSCPGFSASDPDFQFGSPNGCERSETRCNDGTCTPAGGCTSALGGVNSCPSQVPFLCEGGLCARSERVCPFVPGAESCPEGLLRCFSGDCVSGYAQCPLISPCSGSNSVRCQDGTCRSSEAACPLANTCPDEASFRCSNGVCAESENDCLLGANGCPGAFPFRCLNGECVSSLDRCVNTTELSNGCDANLFRCWNNECSPSIFTCPATNGCPSFLPLRCPGGLCVANAIDCPANDATCNRAQCPDGSCVDSLAECSTSYLCNVTHPFRCVNGECARGSAFQRLLSLFSAAEDTESSSCEARVVCSDGESLCADGSCRADPSVCPSIRVCRSEESPVLCPDFTCAASLDECVRRGGLRCPSPNPILCDSGSCVSSPRDCLPFLAPPGVNSFGAAGGEDVVVSDDFLQCWDGSFAASFGECVSRSIATWQAIRPAGGSAATPLSVGSSGRRAFFHHLFGTTTTTSSSTSDKQHAAASMMSLDIEITGVDPSDNCPSGQYMCANGLCVPEATEKFECDIVPACPLSHPLRCDNGTCVAAGQLCEVIVNCPAGVTLCADGTCRENCPGFNGCGPRMHLCPASLDCESEFERCENTTALNLEMFDPLAGYNEIGICTVDCFRDLRPPLLAATIDPGMETEIVAIDDPAFGMPLVLTVPAGALDVSDDNTTFLIIGPVPDSDLRTYENFIRPGWMPFFGDFIRYPQTVISPAFRCWRSPNINSFRLNITVAARIDRTFPHSPADICLASANIIEGEWRCVHPLFEDREANPILFEDGNLVTQSMGYCDTIDGDGTVYAVIYTPGSDRPQELDDGNLDVLERYWIFVAMGVIFGVTACTCLFYYCQRQLRYREKYKVANEKLQEKKMELQRMREVGAAAGNVGNEEVTMEANALQLRVDGAQMHNELNTRNDLDKLKSMCDEADRSHNERSEYITTLESENKKLEGVLQELRNEIRQSEAEALLGNGGGGAVISDSSTHHSPGPSMQSLAFRRQNTGSRMTNLSSHSGADAELLLVHELADE